LWLGVCEYLPTGWTMVRRCGHAPPNPAARYLFLICKPAAITSKVLFGSKNVTQMVMVMVSARLLAVTNFNRLVSNFSVVSDYGWTKTNMI
jgi:hypothetical protein